MKTKYVVILGAMLAIAVVVFAQSFGAPSFMLGPPVATSVSQCPVPVAHQAALCPVENPPGTITWMQWNGTSYASLQGPPGTAATIAVGTTSTLPANSQATVTNAGSSNAAVFNFGIPQGSQGNPGPNWTNCPKADLSSSGLTVSGCQ